MTAGTTSAGSFDWLGRSRWALAANSLTLLRLVLTPLFVVMILHQNPWWPSFAMGWFLGFTDWFDGKLARHAEPTRFGAFWDPLADKVVVLAAGFALVGIGRWFWLPVAIIAVREFGLIAYRSYWARSSMAIPARTSAKYKTFVQGLAIAAATCPPIENSAAWITDLLLWMAVVFTLYTGAQYVADGRASLRQNGVR
jgi:CDP-diacylglycerol--glycerol-3-phosphate 3-phosphatidyltransferase